MTGMYLFGGDKQAKTYAGAEEYFRMGRGTALNTSRENFLFTHQVQKNVGP